VARSSRFLVVALLAVAGCQRDFAPVTPGAPRGNALTVDGGTPGAGASSTAVREGDRVVIEGTELSTVTSVQVGTQTSAGVEAVSATSLAFVVPALSSADLAGQAQALTLVADKGYTTSLLLRVYPTPAIADGGVQSAIFGPPVAPGQLQISGTGFSPRAAEDRVLIDGEDRQTQVLVATSTSLLVSLGQGAPDGHRTLTVVVTPSDAPEAFSLVSNGVGVNLWKTEPAFFLAPAQALAGQTLRLLVNPTGMTVADATSPDQQLPPLPDGGLVGLDAPDGGLAALVAALTPLTNGYPAAGSDYAAAVAPGPVTQVDAVLETDRAVPAVIQAVIDQAPHEDLVRERKDDQGFALRLPDGLKPGAHDFALRNPAGLSPTTSLTVLPGHLDTPGVYCRPAEVQLQASGLIAPELKPDQVTGDVLAYQVVVDGNGSTLAVLPIEAGGALGVPEVYRYDVKVDPASVRVVSAGQLTLFFQATLQAGGPPQLFAQLRSPGRQVAAAARALPPGGLVWGAREFDLDSLFSWVGLAEPRAAGEAFGLSTFDALPLPSYELLAPQSGAGDCVPKLGVLDKSLQPAPSDSSQLVGTVLLACSSDSSWRVVHTGPLPGAPPALPTPPPPGPGPGPGLPDGGPPGPGRPDGGLPVVGGAPFELTGAQTQLGGATVVGQAVSQGSALLALSDGRVLGMPGADDPSASTELPFGRSNPTAGQVTAVAVSPDGKQALVVYQDPLPGGLLTVVSFRTSNWKATSQLTLPATGTPRALAYDRAGSQATLLFSAPAALPDGGQAPATGYCTLH
jgi:hypothetical protein